MRFHVLTLFPEMIENIYKESVTGRAMEKGIVSLQTINIRDFANNKYKHVDDYIYGGGSGMLMQAEPVFLAFEKALSDVGISYLDYTKLLNNVATQVEDQHEQQTDIVPIDDVQQSGNTSPDDAQQTGNASTDDVQNTSNESTDDVQLTDNVSTDDVKKTSNVSTDDVQQIRNPRVLYMSPQGRTFNQQMAEELSHEEDVIILCGHYEGIDERAIELIRPEEVSIGDFVLTGGELPAALIMDAVTRLLPGALGSDDSAVYESFYDGLLEYPQYTRPEEFMGMTVPPVLLSGHHKNIETWRHEQALERTRIRRPDLYEKYMAEHPPVEKKKRRKRNSSGDNEQALKKV